jgi:hypothetical protein
MVASGCEARLHGHREQADIRRVGDRRCGGWRSTKERIDVDIRQLTDVLHCKLQQHC